MKQKPLHETFNDGFLKYGHKKTKRSETRKRIGEAFVPEGSLAFRILSARDEDYKFAGMMGSSLDIKIKTRYPPSLRYTNKNKLIVAIDKIEYDVLKADSDSDKRYLFFYLQEVGVIDE